MDLRSLPIREPPIPDESLTSFVRRHAIAMGYESLTRLLSLTDDARFPLHLDHLDRGPPLSALGRLLGRTPEALAEMTVHRFAPLLVLRQQDAPPARSCDSKTRQRLFDPCRLRVCPACLFAGPPYQRLIWSFRPLPICLCHGMFLLTRCPACERSLRPKRLDLASCECGLPLASAQLINASPAAQNSAELIRRALDKPSFLSSDLPAAAYFAWLDRLRSAIVRSPEWLCRTRVAMTLSATLSDESVAWLAAAQLVRDENDRLGEFLDTYQTVAKHRTTSTGINRAFGFLLRDAARLERLGYTAPATQLRQYLLENYTHGHLSGKTILFRTVQQRRHLRNRAWLTQTNAARVLGIRPRALNRLINDGALQGRVVSAGNHGRTVGLVSRASLTSFALQLSTGLTLEQAASQLGINRHRVAELIAEGLLAGAVRMAGRWRIPLAVVNELLVEIEKMPVLPVKSAGWVTIRKATRQFGPSHLSLARIVRLIVERKITAQRDLNSRGFHSVYVSASELDASCTAAAAHHAETHGWSLQRTAREMFPEKRLKDVVIRKWIQAGLLPATRRRKQWHVAHEEALRFRREYCLAQDVCRILDISRSTLARWEAQGRIAAVYGRRSHRGAGASLFHRSDLARFAKRPTL